MALAKSKGFQRLEQLWMDGCEIGDKGRAALEDRFGEITLSVEEEFC